MQFLIVAVPLLSELLIVAKFVVKDKTKTDIVQSVLT